MFSGQALAARFLFPVLALAAAVALASLVKGLGLEDDLRERCNNALLSRAPSRREARKIVVVRIDEGTDAQWGNTPLPFWTEPLAKLLSAIDRCDPKVVGFDVVVSSDIDAYLAQTNRKPTGTVEALRQAMLRASDPATGHHLVLVRNSESVNGGWIPQIAVFSNNDRLGASGELSPTSGTVHEIPLQIGELPTMSFALASWADGMDPYEQGSVERFGRTGNSYLVDYRYRDIPEIGSAELLRPSGPSTRAREMLKDAIVLVGLSPLDNAWLRPSGELIYGIRIHATGVASLLAPQPLRKAGWDSIYFYAGTAAVLMWWMPIVAGTLIVAVTGIGGWVLAANLLENQSLVIPLAGPFLGVCVAAIAVYGVRAILDARGRRHVERVFGMNVSNEVRDLLLSSPENLRLGGRPCYATVLFVDLRGSVGLAFNRNPADVIDDLNALFQAIVPAVHDAKGMLSRFTGDGFMALFGAPVETGDHAQAAVSAGQKILRGVREHNRRQPDRPLRVGCGINTGLVVCGNVGTPERFEFTVIGDAVNVAARIEKFTKVAGFDLLISDETRSHLSDLSSVGEPVSTEFSGRQGTKTVLYPVQVYS